MTSETDPRLVSGSGLATSVANERGPRTPDLPPGTTTVKRCGEAPKSRALFTRSAASNLRARRA